MIASPRARHPSLRAVMLAPGALAAVAYVWVLVKSDREALDVTTAWGAVLVASFVGWGRLLMRQLYPTRRPGWGLEASMGLAVSLAFGGLAMMAHVARSRTIFVWVGAGVAALIFNAARAPVPHAWWTSRRGLRRTSNAWPIWAFAALLWTLIALRVVGAAANASFNLWDDNMAYRGFVRQILDTGTLIEPFSYHRVGSYCGQSFLHAMVVAANGPSRVHLVDDGIAIVLLAGLVTGYEASRRSLARIAGLTALVLIVTLPYEPHNIQAAMTGVVCFLAMFRLMDAGDFVHASPRSNAIATSLLGAAVCTLRQNYMSAAAAIVVLHYAMLALDDRAHRRRWVMEAAAVGALTVAWLVPWAITSYASAKTFLYPIMRGTTNPDFGILGKVSKLEELNWAIANASYCWPMRGVALMLLAGALTRYRPKTRAMHAMLFGTVIGYLTLVHFFQAFDQKESLARYYLAFGVAFAFAMTLKSMTQRFAWGYAAPAYALTIAALVYQVIDVRDKASGIYNTAVVNITHDQERLDAERASDPKAAFYHRMQEAIPAGERAIIMVDETYRFDGTRNPIWNFDQPGALSPAPGVPYFQGADAFANYFLSIGVRYLAFVVSESSPEYQYRVWRQRLAEPEPKNGRGSMYRVQARFYIDTLDTFTQLARTRKVLFHENDHWVLDLREHGNP